MAANPLPRPRTETATFTVDASTVTGNIGTAVPGNTIDWELTPTEPQTSIQVSAVNGRYPFAVNSFTVDPGTSHTSPVLANTPTNNYPYGRNNVPAAIGHIVVGQVMPKRGK